MLDKSLTESYGGWGDIVQGKGTGRVLVLDSIHLDLGLTRWPVGCLSLAPSRLFRHAQEQGREAKKGDGPGC